MHAGDYDLFCGDHAHCAGLQDSLVLVASRLGDKATRAAETIRIESYVVERWA
jgi:hypothetical protein